MADFVVQLRKEIKDSLTRQLEGMQNIRGPCMKGVAEREKKKQIFF